jgi:hypothetical protein
MPEENNIAAKKVYTAPKLTVHGDVEKITQGDDIGEELDAGFTTNATNAGRGRGRRRNRQFS